MRMNIHQCTVFMHDGAPCHRSKCEPKSLKKLYSCEKQKWPMSLACESNKSSLEALLHEYHDSISDNWLLLMTVSSKNFQPLLKILKLSGVCFKQQSLRSLLTVVDVSVLEGRRVRLVRKKILGGTKKLKKLFVRKKWPMSLACK